MLITGLNLDFESVWSLDANFTSKVLGSKWLFSDFTSKMKTSQTQKVARAEKCDVPEIEGTNLLYSLNI